VGKKIQQKNKKKTIITVVAVVAAILFGLWLIGRYRINQDANRFREAEVNLRVVFDDLVSRLGTEPISTESRNVCYKTAHGPFDTYEEGDLWCQVALAAYYQDERPENRVKTELDSVLSSRNVSSVHASSGGVTFEAAEGVICGLEVNSGYAATSPGSFFPDNPDSKLTVIIDCSDRSKGKHYEYLRF
jgi:hypothetical protein